MDDAVQLLPPGFVAEDHGRQPGPVQAAVGLEQFRAEGLHHPGQPGRAWLHYLARQQIGIDQDGAEFRQALLPPRISRPRCRR